MLNLDTTTKSLEIVLAGAITTTALDFVCSYVDITTTTFTPGETDGVSNNTTAVTVAAAPAASTQRQIKFLSVQNRDTVAATVTIRYNNNTTIRKVWVVTLNANDQLLYTDKEGFSVMDSTGAFKTSASAVITLTGDVTANGVGSIATTFGTTGFGKILMNKNFGV